VKYHFATETGTGIKLRIKVLMEKEKALESRNKKGIFLISTKKIKKAKRSFKTVSAIVSRIMQRLKKGSFFI